VTGLGGTVEQNGDRDGVCCCGGGEGVPAWQALGAQLCRVNIVQCCAGFGGMASKAETLQDCAGLGGPGGNPKCLWIPSLKGSSHGDPAGLRGGSLG
jgi:hypothetical protein